MIGRPGGRERGRGSDAGRDRRRLARLLLWVAAGALVLALLLLAWERRGGPAGRGHGALDSAELERVSDEVVALRDSLEAGAARDSLVARIRDAEGDVVVGIRTALVRDVATFATRSWLDSVRLHLAPDVVATETDEVRTKVGPVSITAGRWAVAVRILRVDATLRVDSIELAVADSSRMSAAIAIRVEDAEGEAVVDFAWDASTVASVVCRDFDLSERFGGVVAPFVYRAEGTYAFEAAPDGIHAVPEFDRPTLRVRPEPTEASWGRVRSLLDEQNNIFRCGLALKPDDLAEKLARLLRRGFEFRLPEVLFRPIRLPARVEDRIEVDGRPFEIRNVPVHLRLGPDAIWYGSDLEVGRGAGAGRASADRPGSDRASADRPGSDGARPDRPGSDRPGREPT